jgi:hypothetical protein
MSRLDRDTPPESELFLARLRREYAPPPRDAVRRAAFMRGIETRTQLRRLWVWPPVLTATAAAALGLWMMLPAVPAVQSAANSHALVAMALADDEPSQADDLLPDEYVNIAEALEL